MLNDLTKPNVGVGDRGDVCGSSFFSSGGRKTRSAKADGGAGKGESKCLKVAGVAVRNTGGGGGGGVAGGLVMSTTMVGGLGDIIAFLAAFGVVPLAAAGLARYLGLGDKF